MDRSASGADPWGARACVSVTASAGLVCGLTWAPAGLHSWEPFCVAGPCSSESRTWCWWCLSATPLQGCVVVGKPCLPSLVVPTTPQCPSPEQDATLWWPAEPVLSPAGTRGTGGGKAECRRWSWARARNLVLGALPQGFSLFSH